MDGERGRFQAEISGRLTKEKRESRRSYSGAAGCGLLPAAGGLLPPTAAALSLVDRESRPANQASEKKDG